MLDWVMQPISYARHRFPPDIIRHAVWLYLRFTLSYRDVEDLLAERGLMVSNELIRRWGRVGGGSGIRTRDTVSRIHTFQACAFNIEAPGISPARKPRINLRPTGRRRGLRGSKELPDLEVAAAPM